MSTPMRNGLKIRGMELAQAADEKLDLPKNVAKGDNWDDQPLEGLHMELMEEVTEFIHVAYVAELRQPNLTPEINEKMLRWEAGDIINRLRFICSKYGAI